MNNSNESIVKLIRKKMNNKIFTQTNTITLQWKGIFMHSFHSNQNAKNNSKKKTQNTFCIFFTFFSELLMLIKFLFKLLIETKVFFAKQQKVN